MKKCNELCFSIALLLALIASGPAYAKRVLLKDPAQGARWNKDMERIKPGDELRIEGDERIYQVERVIASGRHSVVYRARLVGGDDTSVALKVPTAEGFAQIQSGREPDLVSQAEYLRRWRDGEHFTAPMPRDPHPKGYFLPMEIVEGTTLFDLLEEAKTPEQRVSAMQTVVQTFRRLEAGSFSSAEFHDPLKNVMVGADGKVYVIDVSDRADRPLSMLEIADLRWFPGETITDRAFNRFLFDLQYFRENWREGIHQFQFTGDSPFNRSILNAQGKVDPDWLAYYIAHADLTKHDTFKSPALHDVVDRSVLTVDHLEMIKASFLSKMEGQPTSEWKARGGQFQRLMVLLDHPMFTDMEELLPAFEYIRNAYRGIDKRSLRALYVPDPIRESLLRQIALLENRGETRLASYLLDWADETGFVDETRLQEFDETMRRALIEDAVGFCLMLF